MRLKLVRDETHIDFLGAWKIAGAFSITAMIASVIVFLMMGLNFGIDFRGGVTIEVRTEGPADLGQMRGIVGGLDLGDVSVQEFGQPEDVLIQVEVQQGDGNVQQAVVAAVKQALDAQIANIEYRRVEVVGPKVSGELIQAGITAIILAIMAVLFYIYIRFEWQFSVGAVASASA